MKAIWFRFWTTGILLVASGVLTNKSAEATNTTFWINPSSGRWDTVTNWSFGLLPTTNGQFYTYITNSFALSQSFKTITIDSATPAATMVISNLLLSAPIANNGTQNVQGQNTLLVSNAASPALRILSTLTIDTGGSISITNSTVRVVGLDVFVAVYDDGDIWLNTGTFLVTNEVMALGYMAQGTLTVSNGTTEIGAFEIGELPGSAGTLTVAGGSNALDGYMLVGYSGGATGAVWMTGGLMVATGSVTRVGNDGVGQMTVSNGAYAAQDLEVGSIAGGKGTLTLVAGSVAAKGPLIVGGGTGTGTVIVGSFAELAITNVPTASFTGLGIFICDGSALVTNGGTLLATNAFTLIGYHGSGSLTNSGGIAEFQSLDIGVLSGSSGTFTMMGGTTTVSQQMTVGDNLNSTGTMTLKGGMLITTNNTTIVGNSGIGNIFVSNATWLAQSVIVGRQAGSQGTLTVAGGTSSVYSNLTVGNSDCTGTGTVVFAGGSLWVTNTAHTAVLDVRSGSLLLDAGILVVDQLVTTNFCGSFQQIGGTLVVGGVTNSFFRVTAISREGSNVRVAWQSLGGETNVLQATNGGPGGSYNTNFVDLPPQIIVAGVGLTTTNALDVGGATNFPARYYRVRLVP